MHTLAQCMYNVFICERDGSECKSSGSDSMRCRLYFDGVYGLSIWKLAIYFDILCCVLITI